MLSAVTPLLRKKFKIKPNQIDIQPPPQGDFRCVLEFTGDSQAEKEKQLQTILSQSAFLAPRVDKLLRLLVMAISATAVVIGILAFLGNLPFGGLSALLILSGGSFFLGDALLSMLIGIYCDREERRLSKLIDTIHTKTPNNPTQKIRFDYKTCFEENRQLVFTPPTSHQEDWTVRRECYSFPLKPPPNAPTYLGEKKKTK